MIQGKVISLVFIFNKLYLIADTWVMTVLNHSYLKGKHKSVKEQRVDGSLNYSNLYFIRCTLVAGKPVLGRKMHFRFYICILEYI